MDDAGPWLGRFVSDPHEVPDAVVLLEPEADGSPPRAVIDPVPGGRCPVLGRWRLTARDDRSREARYAPDLR